MNTYNICLGISERLMKKCNDNLVGYFLCHTLFNQSIMNFRVV